MAKKNKNRNRNKKAINNTAEKKENKQKAEQNEAQEHRTREELLQECSGLYFGFAAWSAAAVVIGIVVGFCGALFHHALDFATEFRTENPYVIFGMPIAGLVIVALYKLCGMENDRGTNAVITEARGRESISLKLAPVIFAATFLTHLTGGSAGREGAALQMGASLASPINKIFKLDSSNRSVVAMCGMAAGFSALFGTPVAAAVFAMEVTIVGIAEYSAIVPCVIASATASLVAKLVDVKPTDFGSPLFPDFNAESIKIIVGVILLGIFASMISIFFCEVMHFTGKMYKKYIKNPYLRVLAGSAIVIALTFILGTHDYNGAGADVICRAIGGEADSFAFLIKIILTALTLGAGFKGGEIVPAFFVGSTLGCVCAPLLGLDPTFGAALGLLAVFCGVTNCPLATIIIGVELFGSAGLVYYAVIVSVSYMLSGYFGLYSEQKFLHNKLKPEYREE